MEVTISVTLSVGKAEQLLSYVQSLSTEKLSSNENIPPVDPVPPEPIRVNFDVTRPKLANLLDRQSHLVASFAVEHNGTFHNKDLAEALGVDLPLTSNALGHMTRKLRKIGVLATNERDWYVKLRTPNGTLLTVREDVMRKFREAI